MVIKLEGKYSNNIWPVQIYLLKFYRGRLVITSYKRNKRPTTTADIAVKTN
jgi:hypothetical protein